MNTQNEPKLDMKELQKKFDKIKQEVLKDKQIKQRVKEVK